MSSVPSCKYVQAHFERISRRALSLALTDAAASLAQPQGQAGARVLSKRLGGDVVEEGKRVSVRPRLRGAHRRLVTHDDVHVAPGAVVRDDRPGTDAEPPRRRTTTTLRG